MRFSNWLAVMILASLWSVGVADGLTLGDRPPLDAVKLTSVDGSEGSVADVAGPNGILVFFICNHCPWVKLWEERIAALGNAYRERGVGVIAINSNDPGRVSQDGFEAMQQRAKERGYQFPYVVDTGSRVARAFGAERTPEVFLFDADRLLVYHGTIDDNAKDADQVEQHFLRDALDSLISGKEIPTKETKALGCSIKFYPET